MTLDERLLLDRVMYGTSVEYIDEDGNRTRLDPRYVLLRKYVLADGETYGRSPALDLLGVLRKARAGHQGGAG